MKRTLYLVLGTLLAGAVGALVGWMLFGGDFLASLFMGVAIAAGVGVGTSLGSRESQKVEAYRQEWLGRRRGNKPDPLKEDPTQEPPLDPDP